jgi:hypothetical protein
MLAALLTLTVSGSLAAADPASPYTLTATATPAGHAGTLSPPGVPGDPPAGAHPPDVNLLIPRDPVPVAAPLPGTPPNPLPEAVHAPWLLWPGPADCPPRYWVVPEFLYWWVKEGPLLTPLVTSGANATPALGSEVDFHGFAGARLTAGVWLDADASLGLEGRGLLLESRSVGSWFSSDANGNPRLGLSFFNAQTGAEDNAAFAVPGSLAGVLGVIYTTQLWGGEANTVVNLFRDRGCTVDVLAGFRYAGLEESLTVAGRSTPLNNVGVAFAGALLSAPASTTTIDSFRTFNNFYGGQVGVRAELWRGCFFVDLTGRLALGVTHQAVEVAGQSSLFIGPVGPVQTVPGGVFAQPSNFGRVTNDAFSVIPEVEAKVGYEVNRHLKVFVGGTFLYWNHVARAGEQIDRTVAPSQAPTFGEFNPQAAATRPALLLRPGDFWATGLNIGLEFRY